MLVASFVDVMREHLLRAATVHKKGGWFLPDETTVTPVSEWFNGAIPPEDAWRIGVLVTAEVGATSTPEWAADSIWSVLLLRGQDNMKQVLKALRNGRGGMPRTTDVIEFIDRTIDATLMLTNLAKTDGSDIATDFMRFAYGDTSSPSQGLFSMYEIIYIHRCVAWYLGRIVGTSNNAALDVLDNVKDKDVDAAYGTTDPLPVNMENAALYVWWDVCKRFVVNLDQPITADTLKDIEERLRFQHPSEDAMDDGIQGLEEQLHEFPGSRYTKSAIRDLVNNALAAYQTRYRGLRGEITGARNMFRVAKWAFIDETARSLNGWKTAKRWVEEQPFGWGTLDDIRGFISDAVFSKIPTTYPVDSEGFPAIVNPGITNERYYVENTVIVDAGGGVSVIRGPNNDIDTASLMYAILWNDSDGDPEMLYMPNAKLVVHYTSPVRPFEDVKKAVIDQMKRLRENTQTSLPIAPGPRASNEYKNILQVYEGGMGKLPEPDKVAPDDAGATIEWIGDPRHSMLTQTSLRKSFFSWFLAQTRALLFASSGSDGEAVTSLRVLMYLLRNDEPSNTRLGNWLLKNWLRVLFDRRQPKSV